MTAEQREAPVAEFARFLRGLTRMLDETAGWYAVFSLRDPEGLRACLDGTDVPPWDVVESLLHDLAGRRGEHAVRTAGPRARRLHEEAVAAYDARPGASAHLGDRLDLMLRERQYAALRERELRAALLAAAGGPDAARLADELAWARDDHVRSGARARELQHRLDALASAAASRRFPVGVTGPVMATEETPEAPEPGPAAKPGVTAEPSALRPRPRGARFAGLEAPEDAGPAPAAAPAAAPGTSAPRGARFAGLHEARPDGGTPRWGRKGGSRVAEPRTAESRTAGDRAAANRTAENRAHPPLTAPTPTPQEQAPREPQAPPGTPNAPGTPHPAAAPGGVSPASAGAARLARLRAAGRGGEAHALLCAAAHAHPAQLPALVAELENTGLAAEVPTLLWEVACLPPARLAAAADALTAAGRAAESVRLLRQGVARPVEEVARTALALLGAGRPAEARELFAALVRARTPEEAVEATASAPGELTPLLLDAAAGVSPHRHRDITHALRAGGAGV